ncbi:Ribosomal RNA small subunit methyltransferase D [Listeria grayi]|uniref:Putative rRNA methyltransferase ylbH n=1 Tax=Listeria grayi FSL F6-1183 TaxID=1265827 RepID=A0A829RA38_LISGR|nr:16S rRNA (guanine(966)-N(2))-methyltransferase RsmD [Listeria grayi]EUJ29280.1 putative rRNA methyltransferase ylbH [Listeria grayi FSL F6-1183]VEI32532.1 Ribosomal RNA small subunit methyltransferase D [Listeria grayi]
MRVIAGDRKGHALKAVPGNDTRPTTDKIKESLFSIIGPYFDGEKVLDLFAGSGGLGIEALSRGAGEAVFIDQAIGAVKTIQTNLKSVRLDKQASVYRNDWQRALRLLHQSEKQFDLVFLDPPYKLHALEKIIRTLEEQALLADGAVIVAEHEKAEMLPDQIASCGLIREVAYGITILSIYSYKEETAND